MANDGRRICVTGGRDFSNRSLVRYAFSQIDLSPTDTVVEGEARGADQICAEIAHEMGACVEGHPARWQAYGNAAGHIRNTEMLESGIDLLLAFPGGRGTRHCVNKANEMRIPVIHAIGTATRTAPCEEQNEGRMDGSPNGTETTTSETPVMMAEQNSYEAKNRLRHTGVTTGETEDETSEPDPSGDDAQTRLF